jgi:hypothetical protein
MLVQELMEELKKLPGDANIEISVKIDDMLQWFSIDDVDVEDEDGFLVLLHAGHCTMF